MSYWHDAHYSPILMCNSKSKDTPLPEHPTVIKIRKLTLLHYFWLVSNLIYVLAVVSTICFAAKRSSQWSRVAFGFFLISLSLQSHSPLTFMTFIGHSLGRTPLSLGMSVWGFLTIRFRWHICGRCITEAQMWWCVLFIAFIIALWF